MDDPVFTYFPQNLERISKEELLQALKGALESANYWREACLSGGFSTQTGVNVQSNPREAKINGGVHGDSKGDLASAKMRKDIAEKNPGSSLPAGATNDRH